MQRTIRSAVLVFLMLAGLAGPALASDQSKIYQDLFRFDTALAGNWEVLEIPGDTRSVLLRSTGSAAGEAKQHVLSLHSRSSPAYDVAISQLARVLGQKSISADILVVNYDNDNARAREAVEKAEQGGFDLILSMGSEATAWMWKNYRGRRLPVLSICAKDPVRLGQAKTYTEGTGTNFALTSLNLPADVQMTYALELMPRLRNLAILVDGQNVSAVETQAEPIAAQARARGIRVLDLKVRNPANAAEELGKLVGNAVASMQLNDVNLEHSLFLVTGSTAVFQEMETINAHASRVPVISMVPETVHAGTDSAVLSIGVSFRSNAHLAAIYAADILSGKHWAGDLKVGVVTPPDIAINFRRAREIGLKIPFSFFESANVIYNYDDKPVRTVDVTER